MSGKSNSNNSQVYIGDLAGDTDSDEGFSSFDDEDFFDEEGPGTADTSNPPPEPGSSAKDKGDTKMEKDATMAKKKTKKKKTHFIRDNIALSGMSSGNKLLALIFGLFLFLSIIGLILFFEFPDALGKSAEELNQPTSTTTSFPDNIADRFKEVPSNKRVGYATIAIASIGLFFLLIKIWWYAVEDAALRKVDRGWVWFAYMIAFIAIIFATVSNMGPKYEKEAGGPTETPEADTDYDLPLYIATPILCVLGFAGVLLLMFRNTWVAVPYPWILVSAGLMYGAVNRFLSENDPADFESDDGAKNGKPVVSLSSIGFFAASAVSIFLGVLLCAVAFANLSGGIARVLPFWANVFAAAALLVINGVLVARVSPNSADPDPMGWWWGVSIGVFVFALVAAIVAFFIRKRSDYIDKWVKDVVEKSRSLKNLSKKTLEELEEYKERLKDHLNRESDEKRKEDIENELLKLDEVIDKRVER